MPLKGHTETKVKINGKPCQILVDTGVNTFYFKTTLVRQNPLEWKKVSVVGVFNKVKIELLS